MSTRKQLGAVAVLAGMLCAGIAEPALADKIIVGKMVDVLVANYSGSYQLLTSIANPTTDDFMRCTALSNDPNYSIYANLLADAYTTGKTVELHCSAPAGGYITMVRFWVGQP